MASLGLRPSFDLALSIARSTADLRCGSVEEPLDFDEVCDFVVDKASRIVGVLAPVQGWVEMTSTPNCMLSVDVVWIWYE